MLTLDGAIAHARHVAAHDLGKVGRDHAQLAEWLESIEPTRELVADMLEDSAKASWYERRARALGIEVR